MVQAMVALFSGTRDSQERLEPRSFVHAPCQGIYRLGLVSGRLEVGNDTEAGFLMQER